MHYSFTITFQFGAISLFSKGFKFENFSQNFKNIVRSKAEIAVSMLYTRDKD